MLLYMHDVPDAVPHNAHASRVRSAVAIGIVSGIVLLLTGHVFAAEARRGKPNKTPNAELRALRRSAALGNAEAQYKLGLSFAEGNGVLQDEVQAVKWFRRAADQGHGVSQFDLAVMYDKETGVSYDPVEAAKWYRKAAEQGDAGGQYNLGIMYVMGDNVPQDYVEAHKWFNLAAAAAPVEGSEDIRDQAAENRDKVAATMTAEQIAEAQKRASAWKPKVERNGPTNPAPKKKRKTAPQ